MVLAAADSDVKLGKLSNIYTRNPQTRIFGKKLGWARQALMILLRSIGHSHIDWYNMGMATPLYCGGMGVDFLKKSNIHTGYETAISSILLVFDAHC